MNTSQRAFAWIALSVINWIAIVPVTFGSIQDTEVIIWFAITTLLGFFLFRTKK
jgi:hypothetical protein